MGCGVSLWGDKQQERPSGLLPRPSPSPSVGAGHTQRSQRFDPAMKRCSSVSTLSRCSPKRVLVGRVREGFKRSIRVLSSWQRTRDQEVPGRGGGGGMASPRVRASQRGRNSGARTALGVGEGTTRGF